MLSYQNQENKYLHWRRTKIIATLGPASSTKELIGQLIDQGANIFRLNMSHGTHDNHRLIFNRVREVAKEKHQPIAILMDLCGPKIRVGKFKTGSIDLVKGQQVTVCCVTEIGQEGLIPSQYKTLYQDVKPGDRLLLDDGKFELKVISIIKQQVNCEVIYGGKLKDNKGLNLPDSTISTTSFTEKDKDDVQLAMELGADYLALSFVRTEQCIQSLKQFVEQAGNSIPVIAKIEKPEAVSCIDRILPVADGIMIARGDLGIEMPAEQVPLIQKELINKARFHGKPVIVATQMLESMITNSKPTRAEVGDVATAALSSADAVMLSAETASGEFPVLAVDMMDNILREMEAYQWYQGLLGTTESECLTDCYFSDRKAVAKAAHSLAQELKLQGIIVPTRTGTTARILSSYRPAAPLVGVSNHEHIYRRLSLNWGVVPVLIEEQATHDWQLLCHQVADLCDLVRVDDRVLLVAGFSEEPELNIPVMKLLTIKKLCQ